MAKIQRVCRRPLEPGHVNTTGQTGGAVMVRKYHHCVLAVETHKAGKTADSGEIRLEMLKA